MPEIYKPIPTEDYRLHILDFSKKYLECEFICSLYDVPVTLIGYINNIDRKDSSTFIVGGDILKTPYILETTSLEELKIFYGTETEEDANNEEYIILSSKKFKYYGVEFKQVYRNYSVMIKKPFVIDPKLTKPSKYHLY